VLPSPEGGDSVSALSCSLVEPPRLVELPVNITLSTLHSAPSTPYRSLAGCGGGGVSSPPVPSRHPRVAPTGAVVACATHPRY
jgi:hypothetical protein